MFIIMTFRYHCLCVPITFSVISVAPPIRHLSDSLIVVFILSSDCRNHLINPPRRIYCDSYN